MKQCLENNKSIKQRILYISINLICFCCAEPRICFDNKCSCQPYCVFVLQALLYLNILKKGSFYVNTRAPLSKASAQVIFVVILWFNWGNSVLLFCYVPIPKETSRAVGTVAIIVIIGEHVSLTLTAVLFSVDNTASYQHGDNKYKRLV